MKNPHLFFKKHTEKASVSFDFCNTESAARQLTMKNQPQENHYNQAMASFISAGKAKPKQDPYYGKARRLAKKIGVEIEVERCGIHRTNIWIHFDGNMTFAECWSEAHSILKSSIS